MSMQGVFSLVTPEGVTLDLPLANLTERVVAFCFDMFLVMLASAILLLGFAILGVAGGGDPMIALAILSAFVLRYGYFLYFELAWQGSTPGKRLFSLRSIARDGAGLTIEAVFARNVLREFEVFLPLMVLLSAGQLFGGMPGWLWVPAVLWVVVFSAMPILTRERTRAGDVIAGTLVVRVPRAILSADEAARVSQVPIHFTREQLSVYGEHELETLAEILRQEDQGKVSAYDLRVISNTIAQKIGYRGVEPTVEAARFLRSFYKRQRGHLEKGLLFGKRKHDKRSRPKSVV